MRVFITGMGVINALGSGTQTLCRRLREGHSGIRPLSLFETKSAAYPTGQSDFVDRGDLPRAHELALIAAREAMSQRTAPPEAIVIGGATGGILLTEGLMKAGNADPEAYRFHGVGSVADQIALDTGCQGPVLTVSTACSSGAAAIGLAVSMLETGQYRSILAGGADSLCRLTYFGFLSLQVVDPDGAKPFDQRRRGMSVAEGAAILLLEAADQPPANALAEITGVGLSCDAHHPAAPHPEGHGAVQAMHNALADAALSADQIDYINLHGTGTIDNDRAEARAIRTVFGAPQPPMSSIKGAVGHSLAAAGAMEAVVSALAITQGFIPANTGMVQADPELGVEPVKTPLQQPVSRVLSNSFGFGGNNATLIIERPRDSRNRPCVQPEPLYLSGVACLTGAGCLSQTVAALQEGKTAAGIPAASLITENLDPRMIRRLKRLPRLALSLAKMLEKSAPAAHKPASVFFGAGWGPLSETYDFLTKLYESDQALASPTDFVGSVHNAPAGQIAIQYQAAGPNLTMVGGDYSFEQALLAASFLARRAKFPLMVMGADEYHPYFSGCFDRSVALSQLPADGGGALLISSCNHSGVRLSPLFFEFAQIQRDTAAKLVDVLQATPGTIDRIQAVFVGIPAAYRGLARFQLQRLLTLTGFSGPVVDYRQWIGQFASASAVAVALAAHYVANGGIPLPLCGDCQPAKDMDQHGRILIIGLGAYITAIEVSR